MSSPNPNFDKGDDDEDKDEQPLFSLPIQSPLPPPTNLQLADYQQHPPILLSPHDSVFYDQDYMDNWLFSDYGIDYPIFGESSTSIDIGSSHSGTDTVNVDATRDSIAVHQQHQCEDHNQPHSHDQQVGGLLVHQSGGGETSPSPINKMKKKMDHNAKERVRRLQQNATYLTLRSMLPDTQKPKEKWSAPYIIDRTLEHIPQLEGEIETLKSKKKGMQLEMKIHIPRETDQALSRSVTVSINEVNRGEVIIQICHQKHKEDDFSCLIQKLEEEGLEILGFSTQEPCNERSCYNIHAQRDENSVDGDYFAVLKDKIVLWLS